MPGIWPPAAGSQTSSTSPPSARPTQCPSSQAASTSVAAGGVAPSAYVTVCSVTVVWAAVGADPGPWLAEADVVVVLDCLAPWWPDKHPLAEGVQVINIGPDPIFSRFPLRNFRSDISLAGESGLTVPALIAAMDGSPRDEDAIAMRRAKLAEASEATRRKLRKAARAGQERGITKALVSDLLGEALSGVKSSVFSELGTQLGVLKREEHKSWFQEPHSGGLGWSFPTALGAQLAEPDRVCVATLGDGSYIFANPTACHQIAEALDLPVLVVVLNNAEWGAVRASVKGLYPDGYAAKANAMPLTALQPSPDFTQTAAASRAWAKSVATAAELPGALEEALKVVREERHQALLNVQVLPD